MVAGRLLVLVTACGVLAACGGRSGIVPNGPGAYTIVVTGRSGFVATGDLKLSAYKQASAQCVREGKRLEVIEEKIQPTGFARFPEAQLKFRCISA